jgi:hypothetical protein
MKKIKQKASVASDSVSIESDYLSRKNRNDFPHEKLVAERVKSFKAYSNHHTAKGSTLTTIYCVLIFRTF